MQLNIISHFITIPNVRSTLSLQIQIFIFPLFTYFKSYNPIRYSLSTKYSLPLEKYLFREI